MTPKTHCSKGHPQTEENVHVQSNVRIVCRACRRADARRRYELNYRGHQHTHRVTHVRRPKELA